MEKIRALYYTLYTTEAGRCCRVGVAAILRAAKNSPTTRDSAKGVSATDPAILPTPKPPAVTLALRSRPYSFSLVSLYPLRNYVNPPSPRTCTHTHTHTYAQKERTALSLSRSYSLDSPLRSCIKLKMWTNIRH